MAGPGRDQREPMERLVRIAAVLRAHPQQGVPSETLTAVAGFTGADSADQLAREIRHLNRQGWRIENIAGPGDTAVWRMTAVDNRLRVRLTADQQTALRRAVSKSVHEVPNACRSLGQSATRRMSATSTAHTRSRLGIPGDGAISWTPVTTPTCSSTSRSASASPSSRPLPTGR